MRPKQTPYHSLSRVIVIFSLILLCLPTSIFAQEDDRFPALERKLNQLAQQIPGLNQRADVALSNVPLHDYVRSLGKAHRINLYIDDTPGIIITNNFMNEPVKSIFLFICKKYGLDIEVVGTIINFVKYEPPKELPPPPTPVKDPQITWENDQLSFDLDNDSLSKVVRILSRISGKTILPRPGSEGLLSGYVPPSPFEDALESILFTNGYRLLRKRKGYYILEKANINGANQGRGGNNPNNSGLNTFAEYELEVGEDTAGRQFIFLKAENTPLEQVVRDLFSQLGTEYYLFEALQGNTTLNIEGVQLEDVLKNLFRGTNYTYKQDGETFLIGKRDMEGLRQVKIVNLRYRPIEKVIQLIPAKLREGVELKEYIELNRLILSGPSERLREIEQFILEIDRPVPMVKIELLAVEVNFSKLLKTGIKAGLLNSGDTISAVRQLIPGFEWSFDGSAINNIIQSTGIPALSNIGTLKSNFYVQISALEERGNGRVLTRPIISTLNGNEASITLGQTLTYRLETQTAANSTLNNFNQVSVRFETVQINTSIRIKPFVSQDGIITLEVTPDFTVPVGQISGDIPPAIETRKFESIIRMKDGETVVLGGLDSETDLNSNSGLPVLSRIPVLKWLFGQTSRQKDRKSLIIYITPTIYYN